MSKQEISRRKLQWRIKERVQKCVVRTFILDPDRGLASIREEREGIIG